MKERSVIRNCLYCGDILEKIDDQEPISCMSCGKKTHICGICSLRINTPDEISIVEPCEHTFHKPELFDWMEDNDHCPQFEGIIEKIDVILTD
jgi:DNA-directed RNA polymerase subunit RPC12/RpoP